MKTILNKKYILTLLCIPLFNCEAPVKFTENPREQNRSAIGFFSDSVTNFQVDVFYEDGAAPYTGNIDLFPPTSWDITHESFTSLFSTHTARTISVPQELAQMTHFENQNVNQWDVKKLLLLATSLVRRPTENQQIASVFFVKGGYLDNKKLLGIQISGYKFCFIFKDKIEEIIADTIFKRYLEQSVVVHELGHVVGLVNNGVPMHTMHEDSAHPHHSLDPEDVMFWYSIIPNEISAELNIFGEHSLADGRNYHTP